MLTTNRLMSYRSTYVLQSTKVFSFKLNFNLRAFCSVSTNVPRDSGYLKEKNDDCMYYAIEMVLVLSFTAFNEWESDEKRKDLLLSKVEIKKRALVHRRLIRKRFLLVFFSTAVFQFLLIFPHNFIFIIVYGVVCTCEVQAVFKPDLKTWWKNIKGNNCRTSDHRLLGCFLSNK